MKGKEQGKLYAEACGYHAKIPSNYYLCFPTNVEMTLGGCHGIEALKRRCQAVNYISESIMPLSERL